jgi:hypothetical protein
MSKTRFDYVELKATKTDEGYLIDSPVVARTGILTYFNADGTTRKELRLADDVFHADSLNSFIGKPITVNHPKGLVTSKDISKYQVGTMLTAGRQDGEELRADIVIHQPEKIGTSRELSLGYDVDLDETPGIWNGERYDAIQRNIRVNHLSIVKSARAGRRARLNLDSDEIIDIEINPEKIDMPKIRLDGIEYEASQEVINALDKAQKRADSLDTKLTEQATQIQTLTGERDTLKARTDGFPAEIKAAEEKARKDAADTLATRAALEKVAATFKVDCKDKTDVEIKHAVIKSFNKDFDGKDKTEAYVDAAFDIAVSSRKDSAMSQQRQSINGNPEKKPVESNRRDGSEDDGYDNYMKSLGRQSA